MNEKDSTERQIVLTTKTELIDSFGFSDMANKHKFQSEIM